MRVYAKGIEHKAKITFFFVYILMVIYISFDENHILQSVLQIPILFDVGKCNFFSATKTTRATAITSICHQTEP